MIHPESVRAAQTSLRTIMGSVLSKDALNIHLMPAFRAVSLIDRTTGSVVSPTAFRHQTENALNVSMDTSQPLLGLAVGLSITVTTTTVTTVRHAREVSSLPLPRINVSQRCQGVFTGKVPVLHVQMGFCLILAFAGK